MGRLDIVTQDTVDIQEPMVQLLFGQMEHAYKSLTLLTRDMTVEELDYRGPSGDLNSTTMLINHLAATDLWWLFAFQDKEVPTEFIQLFGPMMDPNGRIPSVHGRTIRELRAAYFKVHMTVKEYVKTLKGEDLLRCVSTGTDSEVTVRWALWHMAEHSMLHQGHIRWLKAWARK